MGKQKVSREELIKKRVAEMEKMEAKCVVLTRKAMDLLDKGVYSAKERERYQTKKEELEKLEDEIVLVKRRLIRFIYGKGKLDAPKRPRHVVKQLSLSKKLQEGKDNKRRKKEKEVPQWLKAWRKRRQESQA